MERTRDQTIDIAKGAAIIAIVLGHVLRGMASAGLIDSASESYLLSDRALYLIHLTVFAFLSGLFLARGVDKEGAEGYLRGRVGTFLYLYLVWQTLQVVVKLATASLVNSAPDAKALVEVWKPEGQMWFLPWLIIATTLTVCIKPWQTTLVSRLGITGMGIVSLATWGYNGPYVGFQGLPLLIFFVLGACIRYDRLSAALSYLKTVHLYILAGGGAGVYGSVLVWTPAIPPTVSGAWGFAGVGWGFFASWAGLVTVLAISAIAGRVKVGFAWLAFIGKRSLEIFLAHIIAASGIRIVLERLGTDDALIHILVGTVCGVIGPLFLWMALSRIGFTLLFQRPTFRRQRLSVPEKAKHVLRAEPN